MITLFILDSFKTLVESSAPSALLSSADYQKLEEELSSAEPAQKDEVLASAMKNRVFFSHDSYTQRKICEHLLILYCREFSLEKNTRK